MAIKRVRKTVHLDLTSSAVVEESLGIPLPEGYVIKIIAASVGLGIDTAGTVLPRGLMATVMAKPSDLTTYSGETLPAATEPVAVGSLVESLSFDVAPLSLKGGVRLEVAFEAYSLDPLVGLGSTGFSASLPVIGGMFVVDYEVVKLTPAIATVLAYR